MAIVSLSSEGQPFWLFSFAGILGHQQNLEESSHPHSNPFFHSLQCLLFPVFFNRHLPLPIYHLYNGQVQYILADVLLFRTFSHWTPRKKYFKDAHSLGALNSQQYLSGANGSRLQSLQSCDGGQNSA